MKPFSLTTLTNLTTVSGQVNLPEIAPTGPKFKPLMVGLHGGSYKSTYFDADEKHTAALASNGLGVPWLHRDVFPELWRNFGKPHGCNSMVLLCHSLGAPAGVMAAVEFAREEEERKRGTGGAAAYPLAGIIMSGFGTRLIETENKTEFRDGEQKKKEDNGFDEFSDEDEEDNKMIHFALDVKDAMMLPRGTCDEAVYGHTGQLDVGFPARERADALDTYLPRFRAGLAAGVRVPVLVGLAGRDCFWQGDEDHLREIVAAFAASPKAEGTFLRGAPHCIELSYWSQAWYARCFAFGLECAVWYHLNRYEV